MGKGMGAYLMDKVMKNMAKTCCFYLLALRNGFIPVAQADFSRTKSLSIKGAQHRVSGVALDCRLGSAIEIPATRNEYIPGAY